jgi:hypothetical protein
MALLSRTPDGKNDSPRPRYIELQTPVLLVDMYHCTRIDRFD